MWNILKCHHVAFQNAKIKFGERKRKKMRKMSTIQKVNWYKNLNNCGHTENLGALFLTKVVTKFHNNTESILLRYLWACSKRHSVSMRDYYINRPNRLIVVLLNVVAPFSIWLFKKQNFYLNEHHSTFICLCWKLSDMFQRLFFHLFR